MSEFPGSYRRLPLEVFIIIVFFFMAIILFTDVKYKLRPANYIGHGTMIASLVIAFIVLYGMQKFDLTDFNVPIVTRNLIYLQTIADKYDPSLNKYLISYAEGFLNFDINNYSIYIFEDKILNKIKNKSLLIPVQESIKALKDSYNDRVSGTNLIAEPIWYLVFIICILLTVIFPLDECFTSKLDSIIVIILIWLPVITIYALYLTELQALVSSLEDVIKVLKKNDGHEYKGLGEKYNNMRIGEHIRSHRRF
jgi:hypothetical protein